MLNPNLIILTGSPGTGKTSLIEAFRRRGFNCYDEPARAILRHHLEIDGPALPSKSPEKFIQAMLDKTIGEFKAAQTLPSPIFFDRGIPDIIAYAREFKVDPQNAKEASLHFRYHPKVFLLSPWKEIFVNDDLRKLTFDQSLNFQALIEYSYEESHYDLIRVPNSSIEDRERFILRNVTDLRETK